MKWSPRLLPFFSWCPKLWHSSCIINHSFLGFFQWPEFILHLTRVWFGPLSSTPSPAAVISSCSTSKQTVGAGFTSSQEERWKNVSVVQSPNDPKAWPYTEGERGKCGRSLTHLKIRPNHWKHVLGLIFPFHQRNRHPVFFAFLTCKFQNKLSIVCRAPVKYLKNWPCTHRHTPVGTFIALAL